MITINHLPPEIILRIFQFYIESESQLNLLRYVSRVCLYWKDICFNSVLWAKFDGTVSADKVMELCQRGALSNTKEFVFSKTKCLKDNFGEQLFSRMKNLEIVNLSRVEKLTKDTLSIIADYCIKLKEIHIEKKKNSMTPMTLHYPELGPFLARRGQNLTAIKLSHCFISNFRVSIRCISDCCPNLEQLHLRNISAYEAFPTKYIQSHCPKLKVLHLDSYIRISISNQSLGFPELEVFTYIDFIGYKILDPEFKCIVFNSPKLKFLNLFNCNIYPETLCSLPACSMEYLYISRSKLVNVNDVTSIFKKWNHSLKQVDVSHSSHKSVNDAILYLVTSPINSQLEILDISFSQVTANVVKVILKNCKQLEVLHLDGCRNLGRGMKKTYRGTSEFEILYRQLQTATSTD